ncbi:MAG: hypothetical protein JWQ49_855, partial [Edaphobacter sp.]|nr:hypothetical protein [Edaphobacter sp.]
PKALVIAPPLIQEHGADVERRKKHATDLKERLEKVLRIIVPVYNERAVVLLQRGEQLSTGLAKAARALGDSWEFRNHEISAVRRAMAIALTQLSHVSHLRDPKLLDIVLSLFPSRDPPLASGIHQALRRLSLVSEIHEAIITFCNMTARHLAGAKMPASEKAEALLQLARTQAPISVADASTLYARATAVLEEIDRDSIYSLKVIRGLAHRSVIEFSDRERTVIACQIADVVENIRNFLGYEEQFPWTDVFQVLTRLKPGVALAAAGRWADEDFIGLNESLQPVAREAIATGDFSPAEVFTVLPLLNHIDAELIDSLVPSDPGAQPLRHEFPEQLAKYAVLSIDRKAISSLLKRVAIWNPPGGQGQWQKLANEATAFASREEDHTVAQAASHSDAEEQRTKAVGTGVDLKTRLHIPESEAATFTTCEEIHRVVQFAKEKERAEFEFFSLAEVFAEMRERVSIKNRRAHLEALAMCKFGAFEKYQQASAITECVKKWKSESPSVDDWAKDELPEVVKAFLPYFAQSIDHWEWSIANIIDIAGFSEDVARETIIGGLEENASELTARTVYEVIEVLARYLSSADAKRILESHLDTQIAVIESSQVRYDEGDIPESVPDALARLLYALLGDLDLKIRWRAAHCIRHAACMPNSLVIDALCAQLTRVSDNNFRIANAPYLWLASQLWLVIGLARSAVEAPESIRAQADTLLAIALNDGFPHLLIRHFAKQAVMALVDRAEITLQTQEQAKLSIVNVPQLRASKERQERGRRRREDGRHEERRFSFDSTDTLPYWYSGAAAVFANVNLTEFTDAAEAWIIEKWKVAESTQAWKDEPRKVRLEAHPYASSNRHGSLPQHERYHTHLEWHAMWCAAGELMLTRPVSDEPDNEYGSFSYWYSHSTLTHPPYWLSDLRQLKPLERQLWFASKEESQQKWLLAANMDMALEALGLNKN